MRQFVADQKRRLNHKEKNKSRLNERKITLEMEWYFEAIDNVTFNTPLNQIALSTFSRKPSAIIFWAAWVLLLALVFLKILFMWFLTVYTLILSIVPISQFVFPKQTQRSTSSSRKDKLVVDFTLKHALNISVQNNRYGQNINQFRFKTKPQEPYPRHEFVNIWHSQKKINQKISDTPFFSRKKHWNGHSRPTLHQQ